MGGCVCFPGRRARGTHRKSERNLTHLRESLQHAPLRPAHIHAMPVESPDLEAGAEIYASVLQRIAGVPPVLDLVHLGLGPMATPLHWCPAILFSMSGTGMSRQAGFITESAA